MAPRLSTAVFALLLAAIGAASACVQASAPPSAPDSARRSAPACASASTSAAPATPPPFAFGDTEVRTLPRSANGRSYVLYVALPGSYAQHPERHYPTLYLCDGYWDFGLVRGFYGNLVYDKVVPEHIIVGFGYAGDKPDYDRLRRWDYTPAAEPKADGGPDDSGYAADFLSVVEHEMIPFVEREYRADPSYRVLAGSSLGGLFTLYALFARPGLFQGYIAPSPAVPWANDWLFRYEADFARAGGGGRLHARLFMTGAEREGPKLLDGVKRFDRVLHERAYPGLDYQFRLIDGERHAGTKSESYTRGVRFAFAPLAPPADAAP